MITGRYPSLRLRRNRKFSWIRRLIRENDLSSNDLILPIFLTDGKNKSIQIKVCQVYLDILLDMYGKSY